MYKYFKQLDDPLKQTLKLSDYDRYSSIYITKYIDNELLSQNQKVLCQLKNISQLYKTITREIIDEKIKNTDTKWKILSMISDIDEEKYYDFLDKLQDGLYSEKLSYEELKNSLVNSKRKVEVLEYIFPNQLYYRNVLNELDKFIKVLSNKDIIYESKPVRYKLPNAWYITKDGFLYNTMGANGHKESTLIYPFEKIQCDLKNYDNEIKSYQKELQNTLKREYVTLEQCKFYLNFYAKYPQIEQGKIYDRQINMLIIGIIAAHIDLYEAFNEFYKMDNPMQEYFKLLKLTNFEMDDMFVKFLGMSKIGVSGTKTICTTNTNESLFREYIKRGYAIDLVNPIKAVNNHIEEIDLSGHKVIKKVLDKSFKTSIKEL
ncbi:MAG: hypothetical protein J6G98_02520 [Bacilli bacterium]|nr:hypothetical protein [Bacilli bacterium]